MKKILLLSFFFLLPALAFCQDFTIPNYQNKEDYAKRMNEVSQAVQWLKTNPLDHAQRKEANAYVYKWVEGSPEVKIVLRNYVMELSEQNPDFLMLYIAGWIQYALENKETYSEAEANHQAVKTVVEYYMAGNGSNKDSKLEKLVKKYNKGTLKEWVDKQA